MGSDDGPLFAEAAPGGQASTPAQGGPGVWVSHDDAVDAAAALAREAVRVVMQRAEYEALKVLAWRFRFGAHIVASSATLGETHAVYVSSEEVVHKTMDTGEVVAETWVAFVVQFPKWRVAAWPENTAHADEIVRRARERVGSVEGYSTLLGSSEHFVCECYTGSASSGEVASAAKALATLATGGAATGAVASAPLAVSTATVYAMGFIPIGTATVVSGGVIVAGAAAGAAAGAVLAAPVYWSWRRAAREASLRRLPFCLVNETRLTLYVRAYRVDDGYCILPVHGLSGSSEGDLPAGRVLELDPPLDGVDEFRLVISEKGTYFTEERLRAVARRGSVYGLRPAAGSQGTISVLRVPRTVLPAYGIA
mmetsp:Transcript_97511/g.291229  ORF Transcript_97511/g.291229 Transcript_97511/m.291229 type:complete len:367 (+) Transcript_97511:94-1194(+)